MGYYSRANALKFPNAFIEGRSSVISKSPRKIEAFYRIL
jgi:hypothetical protein